MILLGWVGFSSSKKKNKSPDAIKAIQEYISFIERQFQTTVLCFITDNGGEYVEADKLDLRALSIYTPPHILINRMVFLSDIIERYRPWSEACSLNVLTHTQTRTLTCTLTHGFGLRHALQLSIFAIAYPIHSYLKEKHPLRCCSINCFR